MEKLAIYQKSILLVIKIYTLIRSNQKLTKDYSLNDQLKRAVISISANIAEGYGRGSKQFKNYLNIASGSANEIIALLQVVSAIYNIDTQRLQEEFRYLGRQIQSFRKTLI